MTFFFYLMITGRLLSHIHFVWSAVFSPFFSLHCRLVCTHCNAWCSSRSYSNQSIHCGKLIFRSALYYCEDILWRVKANNITLLKNWVRGGKKFLLCGWNLSAWWVTHGILKMLHRKGSLSAEHCTLCFAGPCWVRAQIRDCHKSKMISATVLKNRAGSYQSLFFFPTVLSWYCVVLDPLSSFFTILSVGDKSQTWVGAGNYRGLSLPQTPLYKSFRARD